MGNNFIFFNSEKKFLFSVCNKAFCGNKISFEYTDKTTGNQFLHWCAKGNMEVKEMINYNKFTQYIFYSYSKTNETLRRWN